MLAVTEWWSPALVLSDFVTRLRSSCLSPCEPKIKRQGWWKEKRVNSEYQHYGKMADSYPKAISPVLRTVRGFLGTREEAEQKRGGVSHQLIRQNISWGLVCSAMVILNLVL